MVHQRRHRRRRTFSPGRVRPSRAGAVIACAVLLATTRAEAQPSANARRPRRARRTPRPWPSFEGA